jgi:hypothetical protein
VVQVTGTAAVRISISSRQRSLRWLLQALLAVGGLGQPAVWFLLSAVLPLALGCPVRPLRTPRGRMVGGAAQVLGVASLAIGPSHLALGFGSLVAAAVQAGVVFVAAFALSCVAVPVLSRWGR